MFLNNTLKVNMKRCTVCDRKATYRFEGIYFCTVICANAWFRGQLEEIKWLKEMEYQDV